MDPRSKALHEALVSAYRPYLATIAAAHDILGAVAEGEQWLAIALDELLGTHFASQSRGPLEVFQEALRFPTEALVAVGVEPPQRPEAERVALPGDTYGLAPASSQVLGEDVWRAHIEWGATKAAVLTTVCWFGRDLADRAKIEHAATEAGRRLVIAPSSVAECGRVVVDLDFPGADTAVEQATAAGVPTVAYGPHVDRERLDKASATGAMALPRSRFFADLALHVAK